MNAILTNATDDQLAAAVEENLFALFRAMQAIPGAALVESEKLSYHLAFPSNPMFKSVWATHLAAEETDAMIEQTLGWFREQGAPFAFWWTGTRNQPSDLAERLTAHGLEMNIEGDPGMAVRLDELMTDIPTPDGFRIVEADDQQTLEDWRDAFCAAFEIHPMFGQAWVDGTLAAGGSLARWRMYVGYWNDKPVATNILMKGAGVAGLYGVGTTAEARRKGIGAAITLKPLLDARAEGYQYGALFATEMGAPLYERLGFHFVPIRIGRYVWRA
jgi:ribosomal protein S18 acetylase RimI-like enzyme